MPALFFILLARRSDSFFTVPCVALLYVLFITPLQGMGAQNLLSWLTTV